MSPILHLGQSVWGDISSPRPAQLGLHLVNGGWWGVDREVGGGQACTTPVGGGQACTTPAASAAEAGGDAGHWHLNRESSS